MKNNPGMLVKFIFCLLLLPIIVYAKQAPIDDAVLFKHAVSLTEKGRWSDAAILFKNIANRHPAWPEPKNNLAIALFQLGETDQAQQAIEDAVVSLPSFKVAQFNRKQLYDHAAAIAYYKAVGGSERPQRPKLTILKNVKKASLLANPAVIDAGLSDEQSRALIINSISKSIITWSKAWSNINIEDYLLAYSGDFIPFDSGNDYTHWRIMRRAKFQFSSSLSIKLTNMHVYLNENGKQAVAEFIQNYKSARYQDSVHKQLRLIYENERWLILSERVLKQIK